MELPEDPVERSRFIWQLRVQGLTAASIATLLGMPPSTVYKDIQWWVENGSTEHGDKPPRFFYRYLSLEQLDSMYDKLKDLRDAGDIQGISLSARLLAQRSDLLGLDAPKEVKVEQNTKQVNYTVNGVNPEDLK